MLTPEQITQLRTSAGLSPTPPATTQTGSNDILAQRKAALGMGTPDVSQVTPPTKNLGDYSAEAIKGATDTIGSRVSDASKGYQEGVQQGGFGGLMKSTGSLLGGGLGTASGFLQLLASPLTASINDVADKAGNNTLLQHIATSGFGDAVAKGEQATSDWATAHPHIVDGINVLLAGLMGGKEPIELPDTTTLKSDLGSITTPIKENLGALKDTLGNAKDTVMNAPHTIKEAISPTLTPEEQVGKIIQGKTSDIPAAQRTFDTLPSDVNPAKLSPSELSDHIQTKINSNMNEVDTHFANDNNPHPMSDFEQTTGKGTNAVKTNYVQQAIDQLKDFYAKTNDAQGLSDMKALEEKANSEGLTSKELNDLAKEHGSTIKAFNANGEAASGLSKQAAENTRAGVKTTARNTLSETNPEGAAEVTRMDKETSDAIKTQELLDKQTEKEAIGVQKKGKQGAIGKAYNSKTGKIIRAGLSIEGAKKVLTGGF